MPMPNDVSPDLAEALKACANPHRLTMLTWLADPERHFPPQTDGDLVEDGVCVGFITDKIGLSQPTVTTHLQVLAQADMVVAKKIKNWVYYRLNRARVTRLMRDLSLALEP